MNENIKRWQETGLLKGLKEPALSLTAQMFEAQRLLNERFYQDHKTDHVAKFNRISIPMVRRVFPTLQCTRRVQLETIFDPFTKPKHKLASIFTHEDCHDENGMYSLYKEADLVADTCIVIAKKIDAIVEHLVGFYLPDGEKPVVGITPFSLNGDTIEVGIELR